MRTLLREVPLFSELDESQLTELAARARLIDHAKGSHIMRQGDPGQALLVVAQGIVEIVLERQGSELVRLSTLKRADFFGELSLFDGLPRSAAAVALTDCQLVQLDRDAVMSHMSDPMVRRLLVQLAARVRRADVTVSELSDKVSRAAYANVHAAVSVELDLVKTLYQRTEHLSAHTLERAEQRANQTLERADSTLDGVQRRLDAALSLLKNRVAPVLVVLGAGLGILGIHSFLDLKQKYHEAMQWHDEIGKLQARMESANKALRVVQETMTELRAARTAASLDQHVDTPADLRRAAFAYEDAKAEILQRYLAAHGRDDQYEAFEPEVTFEAVDSYVSLIVQGSADGGFVVERRIRTQLLGALLYVVENLADPTAVSVIEPSHGLLDMKLCDTFYLVADQAEPRERRKAVLRLAQIIGQTHSNRSRQNASLILASLGEGSSQAIQTLRVMTEQEQGVAAPGAVALAKLHDRAGWRLINERLQNTSSAYAFAALLAKEGPAALSNLTKVFGAGARLGDLTRGISVAIRAHQPRNCFEQRYDRWLLACLGGDCGRNPNAGPIGGECTLRSEAVTSW